MGHSPWGRSVRYEQLSIVQVSKSEVRPLARHRLSSPKRDLPGHSVGPVVTPELAGSTNVSCSF